MIRWLPLLYLLTGMVAVAIGFADGWRGPDDTRRGGVVAPSIRDNPYSYRPVYVPPLPGLSDDDDPASSGGTSGGWSFGK